MKSQANIGKILLAMMKNENIENPKELILNMKDEFNRPDITAVKNDKMDYRSI